MPLEKWIWHAQDIKADIHAASLIPRSGCSHEIEGGSLVSKWESGWHCRGRNSAVNLVLSLRFRIVSLLQSTGCPNGQNHQWLRNQIKLKWWQLWNSLKYIMIHVLQLFADQCWNCSLQGWHLISMYVWCSLLSLNWGKNPGKWRSEM